MVGRARLVVCTPDPFSMISEFLSLPSDSGTRCICYTNLAFISIETCIFYVVSVQVSQVLQKSTVWIHFVFYTHAMWYGESLRSSCFFIFSMQITWTTLPYIYFNFCIYFVLSPSKLWNKNDTQDFYFIYSELALITNQFTLLFYIYGGFLLMIR